MSGGIYITEVQSNARRRSNATHEPDLFGLRESLQHATNIVSRRVKQVPELAASASTRSTLHLPEQSLCVGGSQEKLRHTTSELFEALSGEASG